METKMTTSNEHRKLPAHVLRRIAVAADADPRSVQRVFAGEHLRGSVDERIRRAIDAAELGHLIKSGEAA